jgi:hypothetical protein
MSTFLQELTKSISGRRVFIVGGGPSVKNVDLSLLKNKKIIVTNQAAEILPEATALYWVDDSWAATNHKLIESSPIKLRFTAKKFYSPKYESCKIYGYGNCQVLHQTGDFGIDTHQSKYKVRGNNSGAQAIHLAFNAGAREIILIGYDMHLTKGKANFHDKHVSIATNKIYQELFIPSITSMAPIIKQCGVSVINVNPDSSLRCFPFADLKDLV